MGTLGAVLVMGGMAQPKELETDGAQLKDAGNAAFKVGNWEEALSCYTKALDLNIEDAEKAAVLKNRAAVHLKQEQWKLAEKDCTAALELAPQDPKALYRRCQAYEALQKPDLAYADAKAVHNCDPGNKAVQPFLHRLHAQVQAQINEMASTKNKVTKMVELVFNAESEKDKRETAADNMITLAREKVGAELLFKEGVIGKIVRLMKVEKNPKIRLSLVRVFGDLGKSDMERARSIVREAGVPFFLDALNSDKEDTVNAVSYVVQAILDSLSRVDLFKKRDDELEREEVCKANAVELDSIMHVVCFNVTSRTITPIAREALINLIMKNCKWEQLNWAERMFKTDAYHRLMEVASVVNMPEYKYESSIDITDSTKTIVGVTFGHLYEQMYDDKRRAQLVEVVSKYTEQQLLDPSMESKVRVVVGITTLLTNAPELGNSQLKDGLLVQ